MSKHEKVKPEPPKRSHHAKLPPIDIEVDESMAQTQPHPVVEHAPEEFIVPSSSVQTKLGVAKELLREGIQGMEPHARLTWMAKVKGFLEHA